jgi:hypothetical protein
MRLYYYFFRLLSKILASFFACRQKYYCIHVFRKKTIVFKKNEIFSGIIYITDEIIRRKSMHFYSKSTLSTLRVLRALRGKINPHPALGSLLAVGILLVGTFHAQAIVVSNVSQLETAVSNANSGGDKEIILQDGTYNLSDMLAIWEDGITVRSQSGNRDSVIIRGQGMTGGVTHIFNVAGSNFTVRGMTIGWVSNHAIQIWGNNNSSNNVISNLRIVDTYEQMVKVSYDSSSSNSSENGIMENCLLEYTAGVGPQWYIGGIDAHQAKNWIIRNNVFKHISSPGGDVAEHAIHFWSNSEDTLVENNLIIDCDRGIGFGLGDRGHIRGIIRNNMIYHSSTDYGFADVGIGLENASNAQVYNNTIYMANSYPNAIEYRFPGTSGGTIANNLCNKAITSRNGGSATLANNLTNASSDWFSNIASGDLHLGYEVSQVVDQGSAVSGLTSDFDGDSRPQGAGIDIGADEYTTNGGGGLITEPFGSFDTPLQGATIRSSVAVTGWALDDVKVESVKIYRDTVSGESSGMKYIGDAVFVNGARPDIEQTYPGYPYNSRAGWGYMLLTNFFPNGGNGTFTLYAVARDGSGNTVTLGGKTVTCDNINAVKPFGAIDTPTQGGTASGSDFLNWGWALTPQPNKIPIDGSTIEVWVDGVSLGHPVYNLYRSDIATLFPTYANSNGAVGYFYLDTTAYSDGVHTIQWTAKDNAGNSDGIGSRYFTIQNGGARVKGSGFDGIEVESAASRLPLDGAGPVWVRRGYRKDGPFEIVYPGQDGIITIHIKELERLEVYLSVPVADPNLRTFKLLNHPTRSPSLPIGSCLDPVRGIFYWQPGPGFLGKHELILPDVITNCSKKLRIVIQPVLTGSSVNH